MKPKYYRLTRIREKSKEVGDCKYFVIFGERSNGKSFSVLELILQRYVESGYKDEGAILRRMLEDFRGKRGARTFENLVNEGRVKDITKGKFSKIVYKSSMWFLANFDETLNSDVLDKKPFCYAFSLASMEHDKSASFPNVTTILFDEFISRNGYLEDEFVLFTNTLSTIIRLRENVEIYMCGNSINPYNPYFGEMGLTRAKRMKPGDIDIYSYGNSKLRVAVEFADGIGKNKKSNVYFAFDNPKLNMITGEGNTWEIGIYPHLPYKYKFEDILFIYYIKFEGETLQCEIIRDDEHKCVYTYIHKKTTPIRKEQETVIYSLEFNPSPKYRRRINMPVTKLEEKIVWFFKLDKVFYQDNMIGEIVRNYLMACGFPVK